MIVIAEGLLTTRPVISSVVDSGADILVFEPPFVSGELAFLQALPLGIFVVVESPRTSTAVVRFVKLAAHGRAWP